MQRLRIAIIALGFGGLALGTLGLGGCAVSPRVTAPMPVSTGRSEALFLRPELAAAAGEPGFEYSRRDASLSIASSELPTATNTWPEPERPSLEYGRSAYLFSRSYGDPVVIFVPPNRGRHDRWGYRR